MAQHQMPEHCSQFQLFATTYQSKTIFIAKINQSKRGVFIYIVKIPVLDGVVPRATSYGVYLSQRVVFPRDCNNVKDCNQSYNCII